jgi:signal transduction histidine kinase
MTRLISDLLEYSKIGRYSQAETIDCNELAKQVLADIKAKIDTNKSPDPFREITRDQRQYP